MAYFITKANRLAIVKRLTEHLRCCRVIVLLMITPMMIIGMLMMMIIGTKRPRHCRQQLPADALWLWRATLRPLRSSPGGGRTIFAPDQKANRSFWSRSRRSRGGQECRQRRSWSATVSIMNKNKQNRSAQIKALIKLSFKLLLLLIQGRSRGGIEECISRGASWQQRGRVMMR